MVMDIYIYLFIVWSQKALFPWWWETYLKVTKKGNQNAYSPELSPLGKRISYFNFEFPVRGHLTSFSPLPLQEGIFMNVEYA